MDSTIRHQTIIHQLGHAWIALQHGYAAVISVGEQGRNSGARQDVEIIFHCLGEEYGLALLNQMYALFRDCAGEFRGFVAEHSPALAAADTLRLEPRCPAS